MATAKIVELTEDNICKICENALGRYSCPRCNIHYCSLECYQSEKHQQCSEAFYKDCVYENIALDQNDPNSKVKMLEILKGMHEDNMLHTNEEVEHENDSDQLDSDDEIYIDLGERLDGVDLDDADKVWDKLTTDERQEFESFIRSGDITNLIENWEPWWLYRSENKVVELAKVEEYKQKCPKISDNIMTFSTLCSKPPAPCLKFNLINIITAYAFVTRYFNGEYYEFALESASTVIYLSLALREAHNFEDADSAIVSIHLECINSDWITIDQENIETVKEDVQKILLGPTASDSKYYILCALSDLQKLLDVAIESSNEEKKKSNFLEALSNYEMPVGKLIPKKDLLKHLKKVEFYLSYAKDCLQS